MLRRILLGDILTTLANLNARVAELEGEKLVRETEHAHLVGELTSLVRRLTMRDVRAATKEKADETGFADLIQRRRRGL